MEADSIGWGKMSNIVMLQIKEKLWKKYNIAKCTTDPRVECSHQSNEIKSDYKLTKIQFQNIGQKSASKSRLNFSHH